MLTAFYGLEQIAPPTSDLIPWNDLPRRCVIAVHEWPEPEFLDRLEENGVRVISPARHPFDVLISWLNYYYYVHEDGRCDGQCNECCLVGLSPRSEEFLDYVKGFHGRAVLGFTPQWWRRPDVIRMRYEDLVADPAAALARAAEQIGEPFRMPVSEVVEATSIGQMKSNRAQWQYHFWQGRPGLWRSLIPSAEARSMASALAEPFEAFKYACDPFAGLGYACDPDESLDPGEADRNWLRLQLDSTREHLRLEKTKHRATAEDLAASRRRAEAAERPLQEAAGRQTAEECPPAELNGSLADEPTLLSIGERIGRLARKLRQAR